MQQNTLLDEAKSHFDHWRLTRTKRGKTPEYLWEKDKPLINRHPLTAIIHALNINTNQIREDFKIDTTSILLKLRQKCYHHNLINSIKL
jgi:hypothetical protein